MKEFKTLVISVFVSKVSKLFIISSSELLPVVGLLVHFCMAPNDKN